MAKPAPDQLVARVQELTAQLEAVPDPGARAIAEELSAVIVQMYGAGLERIVALINEAGADELWDALAGDDLVASLLLIHDLYPVPLEERVVQALDRVRPYMESHGGNVELLGIEEGVVRLRLEGSCKTCQASASTLELAVQQALEELCPDLVGMDVEGLPDAEEEALAGIPLPMASQTTRAWFDVDGIGELQPDALAAAEVGGMPLVIGNVEGTLLAYRNACVSCGAALDAGLLSAGALTCPGCGRSFFLPRAGRSLDDDDMQLEPVPLLRENGSVRVALAS
jgi:Fe-S cluster biogenesis protein NfuA/nitrite reductase/ring-hydroxylating ferredoxin subunit/phenylpyruvate tautomerase PptA (4-oxalocrotonate tautomerase family)